jgi:hypothetical protein
MHKPDFEAFEASLLRHGIAPRHAERATGEVRDHFDDLVEELRSRGIADAQDKAALALGSVEDIVAAMNERRELKTWAFRYPRMALVVYPLACVAALPAAPVIAGISNAPILARWGASLVAAGAVTAALLLLLQLAILFG